MKPIRALQLPRWEAAINDGIVCEWLIAEGDSFRAGQDICEVEASKLINVMQAPFDGRLRKIVVTPGEVLPVGSLIAVSAPESVSEEEIAEFIRDFPSPKGTPSE